MRIIRRIKKYFWASVVCFVLNAACFLFMPYATEQAEITNRTSLFVTGSAFWLTLLAGIVLLVFANLERRDFARTRLDGDYKMGSRVGIITFFDNIPATVFDILMIVSAIASTILIITKRSNVQLTFIAISILVLSLNMHCLFNGRIYKSTKYKRVRRDGRHAK